MLLLGQRGARVLGISSRHDWREADDRWAWVTCALALTIATSRLCARALPPAPQKRRSGIYTEWNWKKVNERAVENKKWDVWNWFMYSWAWTINILGASYSAEAGIWRSFMSLGDWRGGYKPPSTAEQSSHVVRTPCYGIRRRNCGLYPASVIFY